MRFGVVGVGRAGEVFAKAIAILPEETIVAVASRNAENAAAFATRWGVPNSYGGWRALVLQPDVEAVYIATPPASHETIAVAAAAQGKHVLVEKPIARTLEEGDSIINACQQAGVVLASVFPHRFLPAAAKIRSAVVSGSLGKLVAVACEGRFWRDQAYYESPGWRATWAEEGGGALTSQLIHTLDLLVWIAGDVSSVVGYCDTRVHNIETEDTVAAALRFGNGAVGSFIGGTSFFPGYGRRIEFHCQRGTVGLLDDDVGRWDVEGQLSYEHLPEVYTDSGNATGNRPQGIDPSLHVEVVRDFVSACCDGHTAMVDGVAARKSLELVHAIHRASAEGVEVRFPLEDSSTVPWTR